MKLKPARKLQNFNLPLVPDKCPICEHPYHGGTVVPGRRMGLGLRVFYTCGASVSVSDLGDGMFQMLIKNCGT